MSKKPKAPQQKKAAVNPLMSKFFQKAGVNVHTASNNEAAKKRYMEIHKFWQQRGTAEALPLAEAAVKEFPAYGNLLNLTAVMLMQVKRQQEAIAMFLRIPDVDKNAPALINLGFAHQQLKQFDKAAEYLEKALKVQPQNADALLNMGLVQGDLGNQALAAEYYEKALKANPKNRQAAFNLATIYQKADLAHGSEYYIKAMDIDPTFGNALANWAFIQNYRVPYEPERIARETIKFAKRYSAAHKFNLPPVKAQNPDKLLHIGLVTANLKDFHPVGFFVQGLLTSDAVKQFTWSAYMNKSFNDNLTRAVRPLFQNWHDIGAWSDEKTMEQIRADGVDILIDLNGFDSSSRFGIFAAQTAPVQAQWLGWFATMGLPHMNAVIADPYCVPEGEEDLFSEKVYRLPHTRLCMTPPQDDVKVSELPALKNGYMTFGCFQNPSKINKEVVATWGEIARALPDAHWYIQSGHHQPGSPEQLAFADELKAQGFNLDNVVFAGSSSRTDYFAAHQNIDLILDTFPYPGGTTTSEALWMGVPTVTLSQKGMIARQGEQMQTAAGLPQFITRSREEYIEKALYWSAPENREKLAALRANMRTQVLASPLFDTAQFAQDWCDLVREIWRDQCAIQTGK
ncbi:putative O-linked N-acetylglucosamine transferase (SPINDLY family) [Neisseria perflava]|uniref:O-linked N-acetylglucosamine transferase, SPINDLY family protein n=1 Tax=Neisseria perflava TaxID=33053 RepID=UPI00209C77F5|nr:tetratricopeptide repeat protein [Neisseria perflava]MCP1772790.1 putative O-linked N-acetylglucosamine transferase (SPINDLY family) [Neisseria perflava]